MLFHRNNGWKPLVRYLVGECSEREKAQIQARLAVEEEIGVLLNDLQHIWELTDRPQTLADTDAAWQQLYTRMLRGERRRQDGRVGPSTLGRTFDRAGSRLPRRPAGFHMVRIALVVMLGALTAVLAAHFWEGPPLNAQAPGEAAASVRSIETTKGQRSDIRLTDGTRVYLNVDSELVWPATFAPDRREVTLEGEAFFDVAEDPDRPFIVRAQGMEVQVLGTQFGVRAYEDADVAVAVAGGEVAVRSSHGAGEAVVLRKDDLAQVHDDLVNVYRNTDVSRYFSWTEGRLVFDAAPFSEVEAQLERYYDLNIELEASPESVGRLSVSFGDEPLGEILNVVAGALNLKYQREHRDVIFYPAVSHSSSTPAVD